MPYKSKKTRRIFHSRYGKKRRAKCKENGLCERCGKSAVIKGITNCRGCILRKLASRHLGSSERWLELDDLWKSQGGKCAYTGVAIDVGRGASIEHLVPTSKQGPSDINNLRWVDRRVNIMKGDMSLYEFIQRCSQILCFLASEGALHV